jgi:hypothetical protein
VASFDYIQEQDDLSGCIHESVNKRSAQSFADHMSFVQQRLVNMETASLLSRRDIPCVGSGIREVRVPLQLAEKSASEVCAEMSPSVKQFVEATNSTISAPRPLDDLPTYLTIAREWGLRTSSRHLLGGLVTCQKQLNSITALCLADLMYGDAVSRFITM